MIQAEISHMEEELEGRQEQQKWEANAHGQDGQQQSLTGERSYTSGALQKTRTVSFVGKEALWNMSYHSAMAI